jgi:hypothetical protein
MAGLFSSPKMPDPTPPPAPSQNDPAVEEARRKEIVAATKMKGRASMLLTGGAGDTSTAPTARRVLLGVA